MTVIIHNMMVCACAGKARDVGMSQAHGQGQLNGDVQYDNLNNLRHFVCKTSGREPVAPTI